MRSDRTRTATQDLSAMGPETTLGLVIAHHPEVRYLDSSVVLDEAERLVLGREGAGFVPDALDDSRISRKHVSVRRRGLSLEVADLGSHNGTTVNGMPAECAVVTPGDVIGIGPVLLLVQEVAASQAVVGHPRLVGTSTALAEALRLVDRFGPTDVPVLILGESGVGKELLGREVHRSSGRAGPLVTVNCATLADGVVQSELFGHVRGAFSGAGRPRRGLVDQARGGTLFLDEIGESSPALQANLLRLVQEREIRPVGSDVTVEIDVRFVFATNRPLAEAVRAGSFREDLYARLNRGVIRMPPLRERREDILPLARHFVTPMNEDPIPLSQGLALALLRHDWPGNARALQGIMERLVLAHGDGESLPSPSWLDAELSEHARVMPPSSSPATPAPGRTKKRFKPTAEELTSLLETHDGNITALAEALGIGRNTVYRWIKRLGLEREGHRN